MQIFGAIYSQVMYFSRRKTAVYYLSALSFFESFILPYPPPDVMLAPMSLAQPEKAMSFASWTLVFSVLGGLVGYAIGYLLFSHVEPYILKWGYQVKFDLVKLWFAKWGFWAVLVAGFTPVPYKIFTIAAGAFNLALIPFLFASIIARGLRFYIVAWCLAKFGPSIEDRLLKYVERIGWALVIIIGVVILSYYLFIKG